MATRADLSAALGLALALAAFFALTGPGRIDIIDGQVRFEVAANLLKEGRPSLEDPFLKGVPAADGRSYSGYGPAASVAGLPLVALGAWIGDPYGETSRFLFSLTSAVAGGLLAALFFLFLRRLGSAPRAAAGWTLALSLATLVWPLATSSFDQVQQAFWLLLALFLADAGAARRSAPLAAAAGLAGGVVLLHQEALALLLPAVALAVLEPVPGRRLPTGWRRYLLFGLATAVGASAWMAYNLARFGKPLMSGKFVLAGHPPPFGSIWTGLAGLLVSPGKSVFLFSVPVILALAGLGGLWRRRPALAAAVVASATVWTLFVASLTFFGGDWAWGPRYVVVVLPLLALAFPFHRLGRRWTVALLAAGVAVQVLAVSVDHQRFFFERRLPAFFWAAEPGYYFDESQLFARPAEILSVAEPGVPPTAQQFAPSPYHRSLTYCIFGSRELWRDPLWIERYQIFYLPRPWPLWMPWVEERREVLIPYRGTLAVLLLLGTAGALLALQGVRGRRPTARSESPPAGS